MLKKDSICYFETILVTLKILVSYNLSQAFLDQITTGIRIKDKSPPAKDSVA